MCVCYGFGNVSQLLQNAVSKASELVMVHQEYQRGLHVFEDWLEQEQASLAMLSHPEGNVDTLEKTLQQLQVMKTVEPHVQLALHRFTDARQTEKLTKPLKIEQELRVNKHV